jgi:hypothetical protein
VSAARAEFIEDVGLGAVGCFEFDEILEALAGDVASVWR